MRFALLEILKMYLSSSKLCTLFGFYSSSDKLMVKHGGVDDPSKHLYGFIDSILIRYAGGFIVHWSTRLISDKNMECWYVCGAKGSYFCI